MGKILFVLLWTTGCIPLAVALGLPRVKVRATSPDGLWSRLDPSIGVSHHAGLAATEFVWNETKSAKVFRRVPKEFSANPRELVVTLPMPNGAFSRFRIEESPIMETALAARYPAIRTFRGQGIDEPSASTRFSITPLGFHAIILRENGTVFIAPISRARPNTYRSYEYQSSPNPSEHLICSISESEQRDSKLDGKQFHLSDSLAAAESNGRTLRTYRLAVAATAEYTQTYGGGTVSGGLAAITTTINAVEAIYERDLAIRLILVANEPNIIFTNPSTDGYTSDDIDAIQTQNQPILDARIGAGNYDIGHVIDGHPFISAPSRYFFQGRGDVGSVCVNGRKAKGASVFRDLPPDFANTIQVVAHEMGHQFGASHTFNGTTTSNCLNNRVPSTAFEPGTGSTIMAYRGTSGAHAGYFPICESEDLHSTDLYFHVASIVQIVNNIAGGTGSTCAGLIDTGNNPPEIDAGPDYVIPQGTPFALTATGSDLDGDQLTYCWEELDLGTPSPPSTDDGSRPIFRSFAPVPSPTRIFPRLQDILAGTSTFGESLPITNRSMNFRVTVRDNRSGGGAVSSDAMVLNVIGSSGPFSVTQPSSDTNWTAGTAQTISWNVAGTANVPTSCDRVRILLSIDGGTSFSTVLTDSAPNTGSAIVTIPNIATTTARIKVAAVGNIFFNISPGNFSIAAASPILLTEEGAPTRAVVLESFTFRRDPFPFFNPLNLSVDQRNRIVLFVMNLELAAGENYSAVTVQGEDSQHRVFQFPVEFVGELPGFSWLKQVVVKLPDGSSGAGNVMITIGLHGRVSNQAIIRIQ